MGTSTTGGNIQRLAARAVVVTVGLFIIGLTLPATITTNATAILTTLAGAQAAVLGIGVTITIFGVQLVAGRYSPRLLDVFSNDPLFRLTFITFAISIGLDLALLYFLTEISPLVVRGLLGAVYGAAASSLYLLYQLLQTALERGTPEGIVDAAAAQVSPSTFLEESYAWKSDNQLHPFHVLFSIAQSALSENEPETARYVMKKIQDILLAINTEFTFPASSLFAHQEALQRSEKEIFDEYFEKFALHAVETDHESIGVEAADQFAEILISLIEAEDDRITNELASGYIWTVTSLQRSGEANELISTICEHGTELIEIALEYRQYQLSTSLLSSLTSAITVLIRTSLSPYAFEYQLLKLFDHTIPEQLQTLLTVVIPPVSDEEIDWAEGKIKGEANPLREDDVGLYVSELDTLRAPYRAYCDVSHEVINQLQRGEQSPIPEGNFVRSWTKFTQTLVRSEYPSYAVLCTQSFIYLAYIAEEYTQDWGAWEGRIARIADDDGQAIVTEAFATLNDHRRYKTKIGIQPDVSPPDQELDSFVDRILSHEERQESFIEWSAEFEQRVERSLESIQDNS